MKLLDTNIFIYAAGKPHPYRQRCVQLLEDAIQYKGRYNISVEICQEILHVFINRKEREKGIKLVEDILHLFPQPFTITLKDTKTAIHLLEKYQSIHARDALHAAVVINHALEGIVSYDQHFAAITEINTLIP